MSSLSVITLPSVLFICVIQFSVTYYKHLRKISLYVGMLILA